MTTTNCSCRMDCTAIAVIVSIFIGIITAFLRYSATITVTPAFLWVLFGIGVVYLGVTLLTSANACPERNICCQRLYTLLAGILGTILTSVILLGITFAATSVAGAIITGLLLFFFTLLITGTTCVITCRYNCD